MKATRLRAAAPTSPLARNAAALLRDRDWLHTLCTHRLPALLRAAQGQASAPTPPLLECFPPPDPSEDPGAAYDSFLRSAALHPWERLLLALSLASHLEPEFLGEVFHGPATPFGQRPELGLIRSQQGGSAWLPTGQTFVFLHAGYDYAQRLEALALIGSPTTLVTNGLLSLESPPLSEPSAFGRLRLHADWLDLLLHPPIQDAENSLRMTQKNDKLESLPDLLTPRS